MEKNSSKALYGSEKTITVCKNYKGRMSFQLLKHNVDFINILHTLLPSNHILSTTTLRFKTYLVNDLQDAVQN